MKRQEGDFINIRQNQLRQFLRVCVFGSMDTDASDLTNQQQQHLFNILERIHKQAKIDAKGIWGIISLSFKNRSGLVLMTMFNNSQVNINEILHKKSFLKDIQFLENPNLSISNLRKILQLVGIDFNYFYYKFVQWKEQIKIAQSINGAIPKIMLNQNKLYEQNQYDSEPDTKHYINLCHLDDQQTIYRKFSMLPPMIKIESEQNVQNWCEEDTISIPNPKRRMQSTTYRQQPKKRKKAKRPDPKKKKNKLMKELKNKQINVLKFVKQKKQRVNLKRAINMINNMRKQDIINQTPPAKQKQVTNQRRHVPATNSLQRNQNLRRRQNEMVEQNVISDESSMFIDDQPMNESLISNQYKYDSEEEDLQYVGEVRKRLRKTQSQLQKNATNTINLMDQQFSEVIAQSNQNINQKIQNLQIKRIKFPVRYQDLQECNLISQMDQCEFNSAQLWEFLQAMNEKQKRSYLTQIIHNKDNIQLQSIYSLLSLMGNREMAPFIERHIEPLLKYKFVKIISKITNQIVNLLYTSEIQNQINSLFQSCKLMIVMVHNCENQNLISKNAIAKIIFTALNDLIKDICNKNISTDSLIDFPRPFQILKSLFKIKLLQNDQKQTILLAFQILAHSFLKQICCLDNSNIFYIINFRKQLFQAYSQIVSNKPRFVKNLTQIYIKFQIPLLSKEDFNDFLQFLLKINLAQSQPQFFNDIMPQITRSFIYQKQKQNKNFNHKPLLNYVLQSDFLSQCQNIITNQTNNENKEKPTEILLRVYDVLMQFNNFHSQFTIGLIIKFIQKINLNDKHKKQFLLIVFRLINTCYCIMLKPQFENKKVESRQQILLSLQKHLQNFIFVLTKKYNLISATQSRFSTQNCKILEEVICTFTMQFIENENLEYKLQHYKFSLRIMLSYIVPLLTQSKKESQFISKLSQSLIKKINLIGIMGNMISEQIMNEQIKYDQLSQMDDEMQILAERKIKANARVNEMLNEIKNTISKLNNANEKQVQFLSFAEMEKQHSKDYYRIQGILVALDLFKLNSMTRLKMTTKYYKSHIKEIKIIKPSNQNLYKFSCKMLFQFLHGFLSTVRLFLSGTDIERRVDEIGSFAKQQIYDILFLNLVLASGKQQCKQIIDLIEKTNRIKCFQNIEHMLNKIKLPIQQQRGVRVYQDLTKFYDNFINYRFDNKMQKDRMINKFQTTYFEALIVLYKRYEQLGWIVQKTHLGLNILNTFIFLMKIDANENILKSYRAYFIMGNSEIQKNNINSQNILRGLDLSKQLSIQTANRIVQFFRVAYEKRMQNLQKTRDYYLQYIVNLSLSTLTQTQDSSQFKFPKVNYLLTALHNNCNPTQMICENHGSVQNQLDNFSLTVCEYLLNTFIQQCMRIQPIKYSCVGYYFNLYKKYPEFSKVYLTILKHYHQKMDRIIKMKYNFELLSCESIEDAIKKYVINKNCNFDQLYSILWMRLSNARKDRQSSKQLKQIVMMCMRFLQNKAESEFAKQLFKKYQNLLRNIQDNSKFGYTKISLQQLWCEHDAPQVSKQFSNSYTQSMDIK